MKCRYEEWRRALAYVTNGGRRRQLSSMVVGRLFSNGSVKVVAWRGHHQAVGREQRQLISE